MWADSDRQVPVWKALLASFSLILVISLTVICVAILLHWFLYLFLLGWSVVG